MIGKMSTLDERIEACRKKHDLISRSPWREFYFMYGADKLWEIMYRYYKL